MAERKSTSTDRSTIKEPKASTEDDKDKKMEKDADFEIINNPACVMQPQQKTVVFVSDGNHVPLKDVGTEDNIMLKCLKIEEQEIVEFIPAHVPTPTGEKEPDPPEPFEWHEDLLLNCSLCHF